MKVIGNFQVLMFDSKNGFGNLNNTVMPSIKRVHLTIHGIVQGVNYRYSAQQKALSLGLLGWVRNKKDGSVEAVAQGSDEAISEFISWCKMGPTMARVSEVQTRDVAVSSKLDDFTIEF